MKNQKDAADPVNQITKTADAAKLEKQTAGQDNSKEQRKNSLIPGGLNKVMNEPLGSKQL